MKIKNLATVIIVSSVASVSMARIELEGFEGPTKESVFENSFFNHTLDPNSASWDPVDYIFRSGQQSLALYPDTDIITFNTTGSEYVSQAEIYANAAGGSAIIVFKGKDAFGADLEETVDFPQGTQGWYLAQSSSQFSYLTSMEVTGFETFFDDLSVEVVPEPATFGIFALGAIAALRKKSKK